MQVSIKNVDEKVFREFKAESVRDGLKVGQAMSLAMGLWLGKKKAKKSLLDLKPSDWGPGTERLSEEIDEILYG